MGIPVQDRSVIMDTPAYRTLISRRRRLVWPMVALLFGLLMVLTALTVFSTVLDSQLVPGLNGAILMAYVVFLMPVVIAQFYVRRVAALDELSQRAVAEAESVSQEDE